MIRIEQGFEPEDPLKIITRIIKESGYLNEVRIKLFKNTLTLTFPFIVDNKYLVSYSELRLKLLKALEDSGYSGCSVIITEEKLFSQEELN